MTTSTAMVTARRMAQNVKDMCNNGFAVRAEPVLEELETFTRKVLPTEIDRACRIYEEAANAYYTAAGWVWIPGHSDNENGCAEDGYWFEPTDEFEFDEETSAEAEAEYQDFRKNALSYYGMRQSDFI